MPRAGLSAEQVVETAALLANRDGLDRLSIGSLAATLNVKPPSLYNHVKGLDDLHHALALRGHALLADTLRRATVAKSGKEALHAVAHAYRNFAKGNPGVYSATLRSVENEDDELKAAGHEVLGILNAVLASLGLTGNDALHAVRALRAAVGGFAELELRGAFGMPLDTNESFELLLHLLTDGFTS